MNDVSHIEIPTTDVNKAKDFYSRIFGWECESSGDYVMWRPPEGVGGGFTKESKPTTDGVILYIQVEDIEKTLNEVEQAGGKKVVSKTKISDEFGFYAIFLDPCEQVMGLWSKK